MSYIQKTTPPVKCFRLHIAFDKQSVFWNVPYTMAHHDFKHRTDAELEKDAEFNLRVCK